MKKMLHNLVKSFSTQSDKDSLKGEDLEAIAAEQQRHFSYEVLSAATAAFHQNKKLGEGGFGPVYKGRLEDGREIAVKRLSRGSKQGAKEFMNEAKLLARVQHRNIVNLLGYCTRGDLDKLLVYEFITNDSLDKHLFCQEAKRREVLGWTKRYDVITGVARGLLYLHEDAHTCIIHRDIKASNILLDEKWAPKIADFGMARLFPEDQTHVNTRIAGTNGYMAPEYVMHGNLSVKADVFSFGVLVLELVTGKKNSIFNPEPEAHNLLEWVWKLYKKKRSWEAMDVAMAKTADIDQVASCIQIGLLCTQADPKLRPTMHRVVVMLSKKPSNLDEPTRPGVLGTRYRRAHDSRRSSSTATGSSRVSSNVSHGSASTSASAPASASNTTTVGSTSTLKSNTGADNAPSRSSDERVRTPRHGKQPVHSS
ncbi:Cysteine-rich receptor-like protein kinase 25 [Acorus gramineus]|uniref:Cysteine-rich receptor-like protein kinase 25 n=1 Tax=Acorus gramineus TaxID=55184 RepID=A0AAV9AG24_ACOGR|nr:Cysteine-rich receptor-like protein kinase 25 [Acorus gramineus]